MAKALGTTDAVTTCDCCGKSGLKLTVAMELDSGEIAHYGTTCAARNTGKTQPQIKREINEEEARRLNAAHAEWSRCQANLVYCAKMDQSRRAGLVGVAFLKANEVEREAADTERLRIAGKFKVRSFQL